MDLLVYERHVNEILGRDFSGSRGLKETPRAGLVVGPGVPLLGTMLKGRSYCLVAHLFLHCQQHVPERHSGLLISPYQLFEVL